MFVARKADGTVYGAWAVRQYEGQEEIADDAEELTAFAEKMKPKPGLSVEDVIAILEEHGSAGVKSALAAKRAAK